MMPASSGRGHLSHRAQLTFPALAFLAAVAAEPAGLQPAIPEIERDALIAIYESTDGEGWYRTDNWLGPPGSEPSWDGVTVENGHVTILNLYSNLLEGTLPPEIGNLKELRELDLWGGDSFFGPPLHNQLTGPIPPEIGQLRHLELLRLSANEFRGPLPAEIGDLESLRILNLWGNQLSDLPASIGSLTLLEVLVVGPNLLETLPESIGGMESLVELNLSGNRLVRLPDSIGDLGSLRKLDVSRNPLQELPSTLGNLKSATYLDISGTSLVALPAELGNIPTLLTLRMAHADHETLPAGIGQITQLKSLLLNKNRLTDLPSELASLQSLEELDISSNAMERLPAVVGELDSLTELNFLGNPLTSGPIPEVLFELQNLEVLDLRGAGFIGEIPVAITQMISLKKLDLRRNSLTGSIPPELALLPNLEVLNLSGNELSGSIPRELGQASKLEILDLSRNHLSGTIPPEVGEAPKLESVYLRSNSLTGPIPSGLGSVERLILKDNKLTGEIPADFCASGNLEVFEGGENGLQGSLEPLAECINLVTLDLSHNQLSGRIPPDFSELDLGRLNLSSNRLTGPVPPDMLGPRPYPGALVLSWNGLSAETPEVQEYLDRYHGGVRAFAFTQTVAPSDLRAEPSVGGEADLHWDPIRFFFKEGAYEVLYATDPGGPYRFLARTGSKKDDHIRLNGLETDTLYHFVVRTITEPHEENRNRVYSEPSQEVTATTGSLATQVFPLLFSTPGLSTGLALASDTPHGIAIEAEALGEDGNLWPSATNPAGLNLNPENQLSFLGEQLLGTSPLDANQGWLRLFADNSRFGGVFQIGGARQLDGGVATAVTVRKLYFTRVHDGPQTFRGLPAVTLISLVNPSSEIVGVRLRHVLALKLAGDAIPATEIEIRRAIPPQGMLLATAGQLFERELSDGFIEVRVTRGPGVVGFELIQLPEQPTLIALPGQVDVRSQQLSAVHAAWGFPFFSNVKLVNTTEEERFVVLSLVTSQGSGPADTVELRLGARDSYSADIVTLFDLQAGEIGDGSIRMKTSGPGVLGDVVIGASDSLRFATALPFQSGGFVSQMFAHVVNTPAVFSGLALDNPSAQEADVKVTAFQPDGGETGSFDLLLSPWGRYSGLITQLIPDLRNQVGGYISVESTEPVIAYQLIGAADLAFLAAVPPVRGIRPALEVK